MYRLLIGICVLVGGAAVGAGAHWLSVRDRLGTRPTDPPPTAQEPASVPAEPPRLSHTAEGETVVRLETETQARVGLKVAPLLAVTRQPEIAAFGSMQEDPAHAFTLRAPVAGIVRAAAAESWPQLDQHLDMGVLVGYVEPRLTLTERIDVAARLTQARADAAAAAAALTVAQSSYENKRKLNADDKAISDRAVEEALAKVKDEEARLSAATQTIRLLESAELPADQRTARFELRTEQAGQVVESLARPGEAVEAGQVLLRIVRFETLLARVEVPVGEPYDESASIARIVVVGLEDRALTGERIGLGTSSTGTTHGPTLLFRVPTAGLALRPGAAIVAYVPAPGGMRTGVMIPRTAVIRLVGRPWVYVQSDDESFVRRELSGAEPIDDSWFAPSGFHPGDRVVSDGVQVLLSEELKAQIEREESAAQ